ncbi:MAG TPA: hypothetical protein ENJ09_05465 [Planctomycetes bacterium]|nr:hypothetical protein [Planctomycetota bacterium]
MSHGLVSKPSLRHVLSIALLLGACGAVSGCVQLKTSDAPLSDRLRFYGNGRFRGEATIDQTNGKDRYRMRLRARTGVKTEMLPGLKGEARISTTSGDANNPHWDFGSDGDGEGFNGAKIEIDRLFLTWDGADSFEVRVGKMPYSFAQPPVYSELTWDQDVSPAGIAAKWISSSEGKTRGDVRVAGIIAAENNKTGNTSGDPIAVGIQGNLVVDAGSNARVQISSAYTNWSNLSSGAVGANQGNTDPTGEFAIWDSFVSLDHRGGPAGKQQAFVQFINNVDDNTGEDSGFAIGAKFGKAGKAGDTNWFLTYYDLDANATFSPVAQDDTAIAGTGAGVGMKGFIFGLQHYLTDHMAWKLWGLTSDVDDPGGNDPYRVRFDLDFKVL